MKTNVLRNLGRYKWVLTFPMFGLNKYEFEILVAFTHLMCNNFIRILMCALKFQYQPLILI